MDKQTTTYIDKYKIIEYNGCNIFVIEDVFSKDVCENLIKNIKEANCKKLSFSDGNNVECYTITDLNYKNLNNIVSKKMVEIINEIQKLKNIPIYQLTEIEIRKVYGETRVHSDGVCSNIVQHPTRNQELKSIRSITIVGVLNDDYDGGEYNFPIQNVKFKLKAGSFVVFPPYWTHLHSVSKIVLKPNCNEYRYIVSCWGMDNFLIKYDTDENLNNIIIL